MRVERFIPERKEIWDQFIRDSKNGIFLFFRDYMEYHAERFIDHCLLFFDEKNNLSAVFPASLHDQTLISHGGLTFGGVVTDQRMTTTKMLQVFDALDAHVFSHGISKLVYKAIPHIYHRHPAEEDLYALFRMGARTIKREVTSTIDMMARLAFSKGRKCSISKARKACIEVRENSDFATFMKIEEDVLREKYDASPVHTAEEMSLLASRFPRNIRLFSAFRDSKMCAGVIIYVGNRVAHTQYMASNEVGRDCGALDMIVNVLINDVFREMRYFDFGISTEQGGTYLNKGLVAQKEMFGARAIIHETFEVNFS